MSPRDNHALAGLFNGVNGNLKIVLEENMRVPHTSDDFPVKYIVDELKKKNLLKSDTKIEISIGPAFDPGAPLATAFIANLNKNLIRKYYYPFFWLYMIVFLLDAFKVIPPWIFTVFIVFWLLSLAIQLIQLVGWEKNMYFRSLGAMEKTPSFTEFLDKFGRGREAKIGEIPGKILFFFSLRKVFGFGSRKWVIEYDILAGAFQWYKENPAGFEGEFRKAKNKQELRQMLAIR